MFIEQLTNTGMLVLIFAVAVVITVILLTAAGVKPQIKMAVAGISIPVILLSIILLCSGGQVKVWLTDQINNALKGGSAAVAAPVATATARNSTTPSGSSSPSHADTPSTSTPISGGTVADAGGTIPRDQSEIFDLGSKIDGHFPDGVAYQLYTIEPGDTIYSIRHRFGMTEAEILSRNDLDIRRHIIVGRQLKVFLPPD